MKEYKGPTVNLVSRWKETNVTERDPSSVPIIKLYHHSTRLTLVIRATYYSTT